MLPSLDGTHVYAPARIPSDFSEDSALPEHQMTDPSSVHRKTWFLDDVVPFLSRTLI